MALMDLIWMVLNTRRPALGSVRLDRVGRSVPDEVPITDKENQQFTEQTSLQ